MNGSTGLTVLVTGDREWRDLGLIYDRLAYYHGMWLGGIILVIHGACRGADLLADKAACRLGILTDPIPAEWDKHGRAAGPIRNREMIVKHPEIGLVIGFHDHLADSKGTVDMMRVAAKRGLLVEHCSHAGIEFPWEPDGRKRRSK